MNTTQQDNAGHIPKALLDQLPPHAKSAISNSQCHTKHQANSSAVHSNEHTDHSVTTYASNAVHHMPMETAPTSNQLQCLIQ